MNKIRSQENDDVALKISDLHKVYADGFVALRGVDFEIKQGDFFALLGPNGAGKSTIIGIITSLVTKTAGKVEVFGIDIDDNFSKAKELIGVVPQEFNFNMFETVEQIIVNQAGYYGLKYSQIKDRLDFLLKELSLDTKRKSKALELSGGMKRRLMIARALIHSPKLLILDEPTAGVDIELRRSMWNFITNINKKDDTTIILTTHYLEEAELLAKNVAIINEGKILINSTVKEFLKTSSKQSYILDLDTHIDEEIAINNLDIKRVDETTLEIEVHNTDSITSIVEKLKAKDILVKGIKPKEHKLETLFIDIIGGDTA